jgi:hypothetical protein
MKEKIKNILLTGFWMFIIMGVPIIGIFTLGEYIEWYYLLVFSFFSPVPGLLLFFKWCKLNANRTVDKIA